jgi:hypothetical protein
MPPKRFECAQGARDARTRTDAGEPPARGALKRPLWLVCLSPTPLLGVRSARALAAQRAVQPLQQAAPALDDELIAHRMRQWLRDSFLLLRREWGGRGIAGATAEVA